MEQFSSEYFKKLANQIMFDLSNEEIQELQDDFKTLLKQMELLDKIKTDDVKEMIYPFEEETTYLRDDVVTKQISQEEALLNAPKHIAGQIVVPKVVK